MRSLIVLLAMLGVMIVATSPRASSLRDLSDLNANAVHLLNELDGVDRVELLVRSSRPKWRIVHIADWHAVSFDDLAKDLIDQEPAITDEEIQAEYQATMRSVRDVQRSQRRLLLELIKRHGVRCIHLEGLADADLPAYLAMVKALAKYGPEAMPPQFGAAAQLLVAGELEGVAAAEDETAYRQADPLAGDDMAFDGPTNDAREAAIVRRLVKSGPLSVIVLGGAHDLSEHVRAIGHCEYIRVFVVGYPD